MRDTAHAVKGQTTGAWYPAAVTPLALYDPEDGVHDLGIDLIGISQAKPAQAAQDLVEVVGVRLVLGHTFKVGGEPVVDTLQQRYVQAYLLTQALQRLSLELFQFINLHDQFFVALV